MQLTQSQKDRVQHHKDPDGVLTSTVPASGQSAQAAVVALNKVASNVARDLVIWLADPGRF